MGSSNHRCLVPWLAGNQSDVNRCVLTQLYMSSYRLVISFKSDILTHF